MKNLERGWNLDNSYARLPEKMFALSSPSPVHQPTKILFNYKLAEEIGLKYDSESDEEIALLFSGNTVPEGAKPLAQAYAGHQFGHFTMLGDGRAILLGEQITPENIRLDIQLKGAGFTAFSRRGDGRATLRSMLREYLISEAMYGLGIPSSRSLAVIGTGEKVYREQSNQGAVLTRISSSHIRVGTFEYVKNFLPKETLQEFTDYVIERHYPEIKKSENPALALLNAVMERQIDLVVNWMRVGFIHGVMNTDNMSVAGETFDYGPCAFMNAYNPKTVFSAIDTEGRYAFGNQPKIVLWNLSCFAESILPLIHSDTQEAIRLAEEALNSFSSKYEKKWSEMMGRKLGLVHLSDSGLGKELVQELLIWMGKNNADYTNTFLEIQSDSKEKTGVYATESFSNWLSKWKTMMTLDGKDFQSTLKTMKANNPSFIPRNHLVEKALDDACLNGDFGLFEQLLQVFADPYQSVPAFNEMQTPPANGDRHYQTHCGT
ncbi:hypothetical protein P872_08845 [Rhodonellum psychrophilum GCM71 = DSM 17998]|uniref:Protein nucleotidyltransferase YdiU n=2 Tax=Rhodonellum TaxID=336827 RepID=U5BVG1_9BACT|nr:MULTISPECIES: YdiU family protein [Rhodonellum]ERM81833.1 hypothetical protein P872_08845 [Rhodonellum psychrophilum GCM71 = DSM 17998]SDY81325.1 Uncharacterized conserved protein YdiU, UPF0061 family [Rhodonellum ikkaensis]